MIFTLMVWAYHPPISSGIDHSEGRNLVRIIAFRLLMYSADQSRKSLSKTRTCWLRRVCPNLCKMGMKVITGFVCYQQTWRFDWRMLVKRTRDYGPRHLCYTLEEVITSSSSWPKAPNRNRFLTAGYGTSCSKQAPFPFVRDFDTETIASCGSKLWDELVGNAQSLNVSSVQLSFSGIEVAEIGQANIRDFLKAHRRDREGDSSENLSFMCSRCNQTIRYSRSFSSEEVESTLATMKIEHDDFHLAQDLTKELTGPLTRITSQVSPQRPNKKRKSGPEPKGIEKFFARK